jgi:hypothetical protein
VARWLAVLLCLALAPALAGAQPVLVADESSRPARGPARAAGVVLWNHAGNAPRATDPAPALFVEVLRGAGFDVFRLDRPPEGDTLRGATEAVIVAARDLRQRGYRRVVLAGQSAGAWIALAGAASAPGLAEVVIGMAPAAFGSRSENAERAQRNRDDLLRIAERLPPATRVMLFFFAEDDYDPGGRGPALGGVFLRNAVPHLIVDQPEGIRGHGVGLTSGFARRFGGCILAFATRPTLDGLSCARVPPAPLPYRFDTLPGATPPAANDNSPLGRFLGAWRGSLDNGDDVMLVVEGGAPEQVRAVFARGRSRAHVEDRPFSQRRRGRFEPAAGQLVFDAPNQLRLIATLAGRDRMQLAVASPDGARHFSGELRRFAP